MKFESSENFFQEHKDAYKRLYFIKPRFELSRKFSLRAFIEIFACHTINKALFSPKICQKLGPFGNSVYAETNIKSGECLVRIPHSEMISTVTASNELAKRYGPDLTP